MYCLYYWVVERWTTGDLLFIHADIFEVCNDHDIFTWSCLVIESVILCWLDVARQPHVFTAWRDRPGRRVQWLFLILIPLLVAACGSAEFPILIRFRNAFCLSTNRQTRPHVTERVLGINVDNLTWLPTPSFVPSTPKFCGFCISSSHICFT